jgi:hypothetical protein
VGSRAAVALQRLGSDGEDTHTMKRQKKDITSVSQGEYMIRKLRENSNFVAEYLSAALDDTEEPAVLRIALAALRKPEAASPR